ncbi:putative protein FAM47D isoform X2 [Conger conger]|uniref:putative protein FAM47D isoform X2 n=1 Tax=Conger conger TaxID=82655 RepID=UPI002A5ACEC1|nr:putative protein FAM47D isoform X2 [Conger conger]
MENPQQHAHRKHLSEVEYTLTQHPLALYPHFQECMSSELLDQVTSVLDPEMSINSEAASLLINFSRDHADDCAEQNKLEASRSYGGNNTMAPNKRRADDSAVKNPYCHLQVNEKRSKDDTEAASFNEEIRRVTKRLHDWIVCLDRGENDDLTESTMFNLLASAFEIKPAFPKQVRNRRQPWSSAENLHKAAKPNTFLMAPDSLKIHSGKAKVNYGVLSLDSKTEKTRSRSMQYLPNDQEFSVSSRKLNAQLEQSYAAQAYKKFIVNKGLREPEVPSGKTLPGRRRTVLF